MLSFRGIVKLKGGDAARKRLGLPTAAPSRVTCKVLTPIPSAIRLAQASRSSSVAPKNGGFSTFEHSTLMIGKNKGLVVGTVQLRVTVSPVPCPARKKTCAVPPNLQFAPVRS